MVLPIQQRWGWAGGSWQLQCERRKWGSGSIAGGEPAGTYRCVTVPLPLISRRQLNLNMGTKADAVIRGLSLSPCPRSGSFFFFHLMLPPHISEPLTFWGQGFRGDRGSSSSCTCAISVYWRGQQCGLDFYTKLYTQRYYSKPVV